MTMKRGRRLAGWMAAAAILVGLQACSALPRIIILQDPLSAEEHVNRGTSYLAQGFEDQAEREFQAALKQDPNSIPSLVALGNLSFERGDLREAEGYYHRALDEFPGHAGASNNLAMVYLAQGHKLDEAERMSLAALKRAGPLRPYCLDTLANVYLRQGRYDEATAALDEAESLVQSSDNQLLLERLQQSRETLSVAIAHGRRMT
jgi:tetratricopeptide (TPR) repeat protein